ncbi:hypothetical protein D3C84_1057310 [compost metagenome]
MWTIKEAHVLRAHRSFQAIDNFFWQPIIRRLADKWSNIYFLVTFFSDNISLSFRKKLIELDVILSRAFVVKFFCGEKSAPKNR